MVPRQSVPPRSFIGLGLVAAILLLGASASSGEGEKSKSPDKKLQSGSGSLVYFQASDKTINTYPTVSTDGGPTSGGDMVAWALVGSTLYIRSIAFSVPACGASTVPANWTPFQTPGESGPFGWSGPLTPAPSGTSNQAYTLYYKITLSDGTGPCGHIIINKVQSLK